MMRVNGVGVHERLQSRLDESTAHTAEIGSLNASSHRKSTFVGSASGVFFVNTVRRAFSAANTNSHSEESSLPSAEDCVLGNQDDSGSFEDGEEQMTRAPAGGFWTSTNHLSVMEVIPEQNIALKLIMSFFETWHPLLPFLHGPSFLLIVDRLYRNDNSVTKAELITFEVIINIASLDCADVILPNKSKIKSAAHIVVAAANLVHEHDISTIQALIAVQIYLVATMSLRQASSIGGLLTKSIFHAGLHRCPFRYEALSKEDREIRMRLFWTVYILDRHLSQALGYPLGINDDDVDVCLPSDERHIPVAGSFTDRVPHEGIENHHSSPNTVGTHNTQEFREDDSKYHQQAAFISFTKYAQLTGRVLELFHKSLHIRSVEQDSILFLVSDIENWWNDLPIDLQEPISSEGDTSFGPLFTILYQQLLILVHRPSLSLDAMSSGFQHGLQLCIRASRGIIQAIQKDDLKSRGMFWPGNLAAVWMSGLIIAFGSQLGQYTISKGILDLHSTIEILKNAEARWNTAKRCRVVLCKFLDDLQKEERAGRIPQRPNRSDKGSTNFNGDDRRAKRQKTTASTSSPTNYTPSRERHHERSQSTPSEVHASGDTRTQAPEVNNTSNGASYPRIADITRNRATYVNPHSEAIGEPFPGPDLSPLRYENSYGFPDFTNGYQNANTWANLDFDMTDIFVGATWESMIGSGQGI